MSDPMTLHGVFPYLVSPVDAEGRVMRPVLTRLVEQWRKHYDTVLPRSALG